MKFSIASRSFAGGTTAAAAVLVAAMLVGVLALAKPGVPIRGAILAGLCLALWLSELVPLWVPTILLWAGAPFVLNDAGPRFSPVAVAAWSVDPVLVLFLGGFALAAAARRCGADELVAQQTMRLAGGSAKRFVALAVVTAALLSMWMSNVAAAALLIGALEPVWGRYENGAPLRRAILLAIALGANVGGIATPIGTGPNGIAMAAVGQVASIDFLRWMAFGVPLAGGLVLVAIVFVLIRFRPRGLIDRSTAPLSGSV